VDQRRHDNGQSKYEDVTHHSTRLKIKHFR
jgi:hypothetical protein